MIYQLQQLHVAYSSHRWVRMATSIALLIGAILLYELSGGFPPWTWRLLFHVLLTLPSLWAAQGGTLIVPVLGLIVLSLSQLALWGLFLTATVKIARYWWQMRQTRRSFRSEAQQVARMAVQDTPRRMTKTTGGGTQNRPSSAPLTTRSNTGMAPLSAARNSTTHTNSPVLSVGIPIPLPMGFQRADHREYSDRSLIEARPSPVMPIRSSSHERRPITSHTDRKPGHAAMGDDDDKTIPAIPPFAKEADQQEVPPTQQSKTVRLIVSAESDAGLTRKHVPNEDSVLTVQGTRVTEAGQLPAGLFVVADGMGGHADGKLASQLVIQTMRNTILPVLRGNEADEMMCADLLYVGVQRANFMLYQHNQQRRAMMGTTMTAALVFGTRAHIVSVGDSRTYLYRPSKGLAQVTRDHSIVAELVAAGVITPDDIYTHPRRNQVTRCLGDKEEIEIDSFTVPLQIGDVLLLCSDGLWEMVRDPDIEHIIAPAPRETSYVARLLIQAALNRGGKDNVSVIVAEVATARAA